MAAGCATWSAKFFMTFRSPSSSLDAATPPWMILSITDSLRASASFRDMQSTYSPISAEDQISGMDSATFFIMNPIRSAGRRTMEMSKKVAMGFHTNTCLPFGRNLVS